MSLYEGGFWSPFNNDLCFINFVLNFGKAEFNQNLPFSTHLKRNSPLKLLPTIQRESIQFILKNNSFILP